MKTIMTDPIKNYYKLVHMVLKLICMDFSLLCILAAIIIMVSII